MISRLGVSEGYATLGHSYGAFVVLQHAVDFVGGPRGTIVSAGIASARWLAGIDEQLASFEPESLREQVTQSWAQEQSVETEKDAAQLIADQMPFHFRDPQGAPLADYLARTARLDAHFAPDVIRHFSAQEYGGIEVVDRLGSVTHPVLVCGGRHDRACSVGASEEMAAAMPNAELVVFEESAHMMFAEEQDKYLASVRAFLDRVAGS